MWHVEFSPDADGLAPGPQAAAGLLSTAHVQELSRSERTSQNEEEAEHLYAIVSKVLNAMQEEIWQQIGLLSAQGCTHYTQTYLMEPRAEAGKRLARQAANAPGTDPGIKTLLQNWADGMGHPNRRHLAWIPKVRLGHTEVNVDPDNIPRYERDLHHSDNNGRLNELRTVFRLTVEALFSTEASTLWKSLTSHQFAAASEEFSRMAQSTTPFGSAKEIGLLLKQRLSALAVDLCNDPIIAVAAPGAECSLEAPVIRMDGDHVLPFYAIGTAAYPFVEALVLAAQALLNANDSEERGKRLRYTPSAGNPRVLHVNEDDLVYFLENGFAGWHHTRCLEPRQTAHAALAGIAKHTAEIWITRVQAHRTGKIHSLYTQIKGAVHPALVEPPRLYVQGPGNGAVATVCELPNYLAPLPQLKMLDRELVTRLHDCKKDLLKPLSPACVAYALDDGITTIEELCIVVEDIPSLARAVSELHTFMTVRADAGKRYRHQLGVQASHVALSAALKSLLLSPAAVRT